MNPQTIIQTTAKYFEVPAEDLAGPSRTAKLCHPRMMAAYLCTELTDASYGEIAAQFANKDRFYIAHCKRIMTIFTTEYELGHNQLLLLKRAIESCNPQSISSL